MRFLAISILLTIIPLRAIIACEIALVVALDVSRSVDRDEYKLMRDGIAAAFLDEDVRASISWMRGGVFVTVTQWGGNGQQRQAIPWTRLSGTESISDFALALSKIDRGYWMADTSISEALIHADAMFQTTDPACRRKVIDMSGDGVSNAGPEVRPVSLAVAAKGVTVNGLVVAGARPDPVTYFLTEVIRGPGAFVEIANGYADYTRAMRQKLLREFEPAVAGLPMTWEGRRAENTLQKRQHQ